MQTFGLSTSSLFSAGLAILILITFVAGLIKVWFNKRDLKKKIKLANLEAANERTDKEKLVGERELDEGDLFGVRAIQAGFFGGVSQSCPNSPSISRTSSICSLGPRVKDEVAPKSSPLGLRPSSPARIKLSRENSSSGSALSPPQHSGNLSPTDIKPIAKLSSTETDSKNTTRQQNHGEHALPSILRIENPMENNVAAPRSPKPSLQLKTASTSLIEDSVLPIVPSPRQFIPRSGTSLSDTPNSPSSRPKPPPSSPPEIRASPSEDRGFPRMSISLSSFANLPRTISPTAVIRDSVVSKQKVSIYQPPTKSSIESAHQSTIENRLSRVAIPSSPPPDIPNSEASISSNPSGQPRAFNPPEPETCPNKSLKIDTLHACSTLDLDSGNSTLSQESDSNDSRYSPNSSSQATSLSSNSSLSSVLNIDEDPTATNNKGPMISPSNFQPLIKSSSTDEHNSRLSQVSIGDFYDTYYRRSLLRQSVLEQARDIELGWREKSDCLHAPINGRSRNLVTPSGPTKNLVLELKSTNSNSNSYFQK